MRPNQSKILLKKIFNKHKKVFLDDADLTAPGFQAGIFSKENLKKGTIVFIAKGKLINMHVNNKKQAALYPNAIGIKPDWWLNPFDSNPLRYLNHSCNPNVGIKGAVTFVTLRDVKKGEELTIDYSITECDPYWVLDYNCGCKQKNCRKVIRSIQFLPVTIYEKYIPFIPRAMQREYNKVH